VPSDPAVAVVLAQSVEGLCRRRPSNCRQLHPQDDIEPRMRLAENSADPLVIHNRQGFVRVPTILLRLVVIPS
jgi:hypothetical protein